MLQPQALNIYSVFLGIIGFIIAFIFLKTTKSNPYSNRYIILIFIIASTHAIFTGIFKDKDPNFYQNSMNWLDPFFALTIPSFYLYFKILLNDKRYLTKDLFHFTYPFLVLLFLYLNRSYFFISDDVYNYITFGLTLLFIIIYVILSYQLLNNSLWKNKEKQIILGNHYILIKQWTHFFLLFFLLLMLALMSTVYLEINEKEESIFTILASLLIWLAFFIKILKHPIILYGFKSLEKKVNKHNTNNLINPLIWNLSSPIIKNEQDKKLSILIKEKIEGYIEEVEIYVAHTLPFRDIKFNMNDLGKALKIPNSHIGYLFKYHNKVNFVTYRNYCKIQDAQTLIKEKYLRTNTIESLSKKIGYISYNTFFVAYKKQCGISPNKNR